jgi:hypothetical protein
VAIFTKEDRQSVEDLFYTKLAKYDYTKRDDKSLGVALKEKNPISSYVFLLSRQNVNCLEIERTLMFLRLISC